MNFEQIKSSVDALIKNNRLKDAIQICLLQANECYDSELKDWANGITRTFNQAEADYNGTIITKADYDAQLKEITSDISKFLNLLEQFLLNNDISISGHAAYQLRHIIKSMRGNPMLLGNSNLFVDDFKAVLAEIKKSYEVILNLIVEFNAPLFKTPLEFQTYNTLSSGIIHNQLNEGRGHCHIIFDHYESKIRPILSNQSQNENDLFDDVNFIFAQLGDADHTIFSQLIEAGKFIENQSRLIADMHLDGKTDEAKLTILQSRKKLKALQEELSAALDEMVELEFQLAF